MMRRLVGGGVAVVTLGIAAMLLAAYAAGWEMAVSVRRALIVAGGVGLVVWWLAHQPPLARPMRWARRRQPQAHLPDDRTREIAAAILGARDRPARLARALAPAVGARDEKRLPAELGAFLRDPGRPPGPDTLDAWIGALERADER